MLEGWISDGSKGSSTTRPSASSARRSRSESSTIQRVPWPTREQPDLGAQLGHVGARLGERKSLPVDGVVAVGELEVDAGAVDADEQGPLGGKAAAHAHGDPRNDAAARVVEVLQPVSLQVGEGVGSGGGEVVGGDVGDAVVVGEHDPVGA